MKRSVHFGMNQVSGAAYGGWQGFLAGCWADAEDMQGVFAGLGYDARGFFDDECLLDKARREISEAAAACVKDDWFLFSDSGHGSQSSGAFFGTEEGMCLYDGIMVDSEFRSLLAQFKAGVNVVVILDICHAGGLSRAMPSVRSRVAPLHVTRNMKGSPKSDAIIQANVILLAACQKDELSGDGDENGAFTGSFLESMKLGQTWASWMDATSRYMSRNFQSQHPQLISLNGALADLPV